MLDVLSGGPIGAGQAGKRESFRDQTGLAKYCERFDFADQLALPLAGLNREIYREIVNFVHQLARYIPEINALRPNSAVRWKQRIVCRQQGSVQR